jgi:hypothetical protein
MKCGLDWLPVVLFRKFLPTLLPAVLLIVNHSLRCGMADIMKVAHIIPLLKNKKLDPNDLSNYRPVSNLSFISKLVERIVAVRLQNHLSMNNLNDLNQHAFKLNHSCESALVTITDVAHSEIDQGKVMLLVLLDMSAAFDTVDHVILLQQLDFLGVRGAALSWFKTYLSGRKQSVVIGDVVSTPRDLVTGVPQGSVLGPLLFSIYLIGINQIITEHNVDYVLYADDLQLFVSSAPDKLPEAISRMESCIHHIRRWFMGRFLLLNDKKTEAIIIGSNNLIKKCPSVILNVGTTLIRPVHSNVRDLGFLIDSELRYDSHVNKVCRDAFAHLKVIARIRKSLPKSSLLLLVNALVFSRIDYCGVILYNVSEKQLRRLQSIMNAAVRMIYRLKKGDSITPLLRSAKLLPVKQRLLCRSLCFIYNVLRSSSPKSLSSKLHVDHPNRVLRSQSQGVLLQIPSINKKHGERAFRRFAPKLWNSLPQSIREAPKIGTFKSMVDDHLLAHCL